MNSLELNIIHDQIRSLTAEINEATRIQSASQQNIQKLIASNKEYVQSLNVAYEQASINQINLNNNISEFGFLMESKSLIALNTKKEKLELSIQSIKEQIILTNQMTIQLEESFNKTSYSIQSCKNVLDNVIPTRNISISEPQSKEKMQEDDLEALIDSLDMTC